MAVVTLNATVTVAYPGQKPVTVSAPPLTANLDPSTGKK